MVLMIRESDLKLVLANRRNFIGLKPRVSSLLDSVAGIFYIPTAFAVENMAIRIFMIVLGGIVILYGIAGVIAKPYTTDKLYGEISGMNLIYSSIIAIRQPGVTDSNKYLVYWDEGWKCWFFPNRRSTPNVEDDERDIVNYLHTEFKVPVEDCAVHLKTTSASKKLSTEHNEERNYEYRLYSGAIKQLPQQWSLEGEFAIGQRTCRWMSIGEMMNDSETVKINHDVIALVRDNA